MSDDEVSNCSDDLVLPAVTIDQPAMPKQLPSGYWEEENDRLKQFCRLQINCILLILCAGLFFNGSLVTLFCTFLSNQYIDMADKV